MILLQLLLGGLYDVARGELEGFVIGGERVSVDEYPYSAFLDIACENGWVCGASILNQHFTLTAAHCVKECSKHEKIYVSVGHEHKKMGVVSTAKSWKVHPSFDPENSDNACVDLAIVRVKTPFKFGRTVQRVILMKNPPSAKMAHIAGWGVIDETFETPTDYLKHTVQKLWSIKECKEIISSIPACDFCAGSRGGNNYVANGDSGSALTIQGHIQIGLVSYKIKDISRTIVLYTNVSKYYNWIVENTKNLYCG